MMTKLTAIAAETHETAEAAKKTAAETRRVARSNRLLSLAMVVLALTGAAGMFWVGGRIGALGEKVRPSAAEEQRRLKETMEADEKVEAVLAKLAEDLEADRALVLLAHNGQTDLSGLVPFMWLSVSHLHLRAGLAWEERWGRPRALSGFTPTFRRMFRDGRDKPRCVRRDRGDADLSEVSRALMADRGVTLVLVCPLLTAKGEVIGLVSSEYLRRETAPRDAEGALRRVERAALEARIALTERSP